MLNNWCWMQPSMSPNCSLRYSHPTAVDPLVMHGAGSWPVSREPAATRWEPDLEGQGCAGNTAASWHWPTPRLTSSTLARPACTCTGAWLATRLVHYLPTPGHQARWTACARVAAPAGDVCNVSLASRDTLYHWCASDGFPTTINNNNNYYYYTTITLDRESAQEIEGQISRDLRLIL